MSSTPYVQFQDEHPIEKPFRQFHSRKKQTIQQRLENKYNRILRPKLEQAGILKDEETFTYDPTSSPSEDTPPAGCCTIA